MSKLNFQDVDQMTPDEQSIFFQQLSTELRQEDESAARSNLAAGVPIYYRHETFKEPGQIVKQYPSGRMELIRMDEHGDECLIKVLIDKDSDIEISMEEKLKIIRNVEASEALEGYAPLTEGYAYELEQKWVRGEITLEEKGKLLADYYGYTYSG